MKMLSLTSIRPDLPRSLLKDIVASLLAPVTPDHHAAGVLDIDVGRLRSLGVQGILLDVDCTLKDHGAPGFTEIVIAWAASLRGEGFRLCLVSNGKAHRISALADALGVPFVATAFKPFPFGCRAASRKLGLGPAQVVMVGDQVFADVLAGRLAGLRTILVTPTSRREPWFTRAKRPLERCVLALIGWRVSPWNAVEVPTEES